MLNYSRALVRKKIIKLLLPSAFFIAFTLLIKDLGTATVQPMGWKAAVPGAVFALGFFGWQFLSEKFPVWFLGNGRGWLMYFWLKGSISVLIGLIIGPYQIYKHIIDISKSRVLIKEIEERKNSSIRSEATGNLIN